MKGSFVEPGRLIYRLGLWCFYTFLNVWMKTLRVKYSDTTGVSAGTNKSTAILVFWHNRVAVAPFLLSSKTCEKTVAMASRSKDGQIIADILARLKIQAVRGSANKRGRDKGGAAALIQSLKILREPDKFLCLIPDGPRGPMYSVQPGVVMLAAKSQREIIPFTVNMSCFFTLKTWDKLMLPLPFSRAEVVFGEPLKYDKESASSEEALAAGRERLRQALNELCE
jgi:3-deoxy-D-manno-octulosonic-acid transferase